MYKKIIIIALLENVSSFPQETDKQQNTVPFIVAWAVAVATEKAQKSKDIKGKIIGS